jgi:PAS domain S-box-containing protein
MTTPQTGIFRPSAATIDPDRQRTDFELVLSISADMATQTSLTALLDRSVNRVREGYGLYHAQIYLLNPDGDSLVLSASSGEVGQKLIKSAHHIPTTHPTSIVARAARDRAAVIVNDTRQAETFLPNPLLPDIRAEMAVPMLAGDALIGVLDVQSAEPHRFSEHDQRVETLLAEQLALAVQNTRFAEQAAKYAVSINTVFEVGREISRQRASADLLWTVANLCEQRFGLYHVHIYIFNPETQYLMLSAASGDIGRQQVARSHAIALARRNSLVARAARERRPVIVSDVTADENYLPNPQLPDTRSEMAVPMEDQDGLIGVLDLQATQVNRFDASDIEALTVLAGQISSAIINARAFEAIQQSERQSRLLAEVTENTSTGIYVYHLETPDDPLSLRLMVANTASQRATGIAPSSVLGKRIGEAFPALIESSVPQIYQRVALNGGNVHLGEVVYQHPDDPEPNTYDVRAFGLPNQSVGISFENVTERKQAEERLRLLTAAVEHSTTGLSIADARQPDNPVIYINPAYSMITGYAPEEIIGRNTRFLQGSDTEQPGLKAIRSAIKDKRSVSTVVRNYRKNGTLFYNQVNISPLRNAAGEVTHFVGISADVTDRVITEQLASRRARELAIVADIATQISTSHDVRGLLKEAANQLVSGFDLYHANLYLYDREHNLLRLEAASGQVGDLLVRRAHAIKMEARSLVARAARNLEVVIEQDTANSPDFLPNPLLPETRSEMAVPMLVAGELIGVLDVQARTPNRFDAEDAQIKTTLAAQIGAAIQNAQAYTEIEQTAERLREVDRMKSQFLANMSHELRTPLNSIIGYSEILIEGMDGDLSDDALEDVHAIHDSGKHLLGLINEILDQAKIEAGQMQLDWQVVSITETAHEVAKMGVALRKDKPIELRVDVVGDIPAVRADSFRLRQIMLNLVSNAIKFTEQGTVTIRLSKDEDLNRVRVSVIDTGVGISEDNLGVIFERFSQVDNSSTRRVGGTGLGLTITRQLVEMHGGTIEVSSKLGEGSTFSFTLEIA